MKLTAITSALKSLAVAGMLLTLATFIFTQSAHASTSSDTQVTQVLPTLLSETQMVLSAVSKRIATDEALAAGANSQDAELANLEEQLKALLKQIDTLKAKPSARSSMSIDVTPIASGTTWNVGTKQTVKWTSKNLGSLDVNLFLADSFNGSSIYLELGVANKGTYTGTVPTSIPSGTYQLFICSNDKGPSVCSDDYGVKEYVTIVNSDAAVNEKIIVTSPVSGSTYKAGEKIYVTATYGGESGAKSLTVLLDGASDDGSWIKIGKLNSRGVLYKELPHNLKSGEYDLNVCLNKCGESVRIKIGGAASTTAGLPLVTSVQAKAGDEFEVYAGESIAIGGKNLIYAAKDTEVFVGGKKAVVTQYASEVIYFTAPSLSAGKYDLRVRTTAGWSNTVKVTVVNNRAVTTGKPVISITPSSPSIAIGGTVKFEWNITPTTGTTCYAAGNGLGGTEKVALSGTWTTPKLYADTSYGVRCYGTAGITDKYIDVDVAAAATTPTASTVDKPVISITPSSPSIQNGETVTFKWNITPTSGTVCYGAGNGLSDVERVALTGTWTTPKLYADTTYGVQCTNGAGVTDKYIDVRVADAEIVEKPYIDITPTYSYIDVGDTVTFDWNITPSTGTVCYASGTGLTGYEQVALTGTWTTPALYSDTDYEVQCSNAAGTTYRTLSVMVY